MENLEKYRKLIPFIRKEFNTAEDFIPLHEPRFIGNERKYVMDVIDSTFVSSVGEYVNRFEQMMCELTGAKYAVATVNGTSALHIALKLAGVNQGDEVITQSLTFIATSNAIAYCGAQPVFVDVDKSNMGLCPQALRKFLEEHAEVKNGIAYNKGTGKKISAVLPMHTFGLPCNLEDLQEVCEDYGLPLVEDAAESLGSYYQGKHTGTFGLLGTFSFNGNKTVACGGGGAIVTDNEELAKMAKHLTTTAKVPHTWEYTHDHIGYNYRMPNLNAAMACAQLEQLPSYLENKRELAAKYAVLCNELGISFIQEEEGSTSNYWLNAICLQHREERDEVLKMLNEAGIMCRPIWTLSHKMPMYAHCQRDEQVNAKWLEDRIVNIPSSVRFEK